MRVYREAPFLCLKALFMLFIWDLIKRLQMLVKNEKIWAVLFLLWTKTNVHLFIYASQEWQRSAKLYLVTATQDSYRQAFM